jgi:L-cysteine/cystine lyase
LNLDIGQIRSEIPVVGLMTYLNTGWSGPSPTYVVEAIEKRLRYESYSGPTTTEVLESGIAIRNRSKEAVARLFNATPEEILLTENTTEGLNVVLNGLRFDAGDEVIICDLEHPSVLLPAYNLRANRDVSVKIVSPGPDPTPEQLVDLYSGAMTNRTRLVFLSHVQYSTGVRMPVAEIAERAHAMGAQVLVDGAQGPGHLALDMPALGVDFYSSPGQKWLLGPDQTGALFIRRDRVPELHPSRIGHAFAESYDLKGGFVPARDDIGKFMVSTTSMPLRAGYLAAVERILDLGPGLVEARQLALAGRLKRALSDTPGVRVLSPLTGAGCTGLTTFTVDGMDNEVVAGRLWADSTILVRAIGHPLAVRASASFFNTEDEVDALADAVRGLAPG